MISGVTIMVQESRQHSIGKRPLDQWNGTESLEIDLHIYGQLIFAKDVREIQP